MDQNPTLNILIIAESLTDGEQLVNTLRKAGYGVHAEAVRNEGFLRERLATRGWDMVFLFAGAQRLSAESLQAVLDEMNQDIPCIVLGSTAATASLQATMPDAYVVTTAADSASLLPVAPLLRSIQHARQNLQAHRELSKASAALKDLQHRYQLLLNSASDAVGYLHEGLHIYTNQAYATLFGYRTPEELRSVAFLDLVDEADLGEVRHFLRAECLEDARQCIFNGRTANRLTLRLSLECAIVPYESERCQQIIIKPVQGNVEQQHRTRVLQGQDLLTDLLNRSSFTSRIEQAISNAIYDQQLSILVLVRLQDFEEFVALSGKPAGNFLLADTARILREMATPNSVLGRTAESEFALLIPTEKDAHESMDLLALETGMNQALQPLLPSGSGVRLVAGLAAVNELSPDAESIIGRALRHLVVRDSAYRAPAGSVPDPYKNPQLMFERLEEAFANEDFILVFQPIVSLKEDGLERYEVRIRLQDNDNLIYPPRFLELANQYGLGEQIDRWVITDSFRVLKEHNNPALQLTINLTHNSIMSPDFLPWLHQQLHETRQSVEQLVFQISELDIVGCPEPVVTFCQKIQELQIPLSITHFGCTLTPFKYLPREQAEFVKLDKSLLDNIGEDASQREKLNNTVNSLHASGLLVIAPMIDEIDLLPLLWQANVNFVQGNCLQEPSANMDFSFVQEEEITLDSFR